jgi:type IV pilus assembly protein PilA
MRADFALIVRRNLQEVVNMKSGLVRLSLVAMSSILLVTAVAATQKGSNWDATDDQKSAVGSIRSINTAEVYYGREYKKGWSPTLASLGVSPDGGKPSAAAAGLLDNSLTNGKKRNHVFTYKAGTPDASGNIKTYALSVRPVKWHPGHWNFFTDESGIIRGTQENRAATVDDPPLQ